MFKKIGMFSMLLCSMHTQAQVEHHLDLVLDWVINPNHGPIIVAKQKGFFKEEHLDVTLYEPTDPAMPAKLVATKKYDLAVTYQETFTYDLEQKLPLMKVSTLISGPLNCIMVLKKSGITKLSQLDGKKLGYSIPSEVKLLDVMLNHDQLEAVKTKKIHIGWNIAPSLLSGQVDAVSGAHRNVEKHQMNMHGEEVTIFYPEEHGVPNHDELIIVAHHSNKRKEDLRAFNRALDRAVQYISNHPSEAWKSFVSYNKKNLDNELTHRSWKDSLVRYDHRPAAIDVERYITYAKYLKKNGVIKEIPDFSHAFFR